MSFINFVFWIDAIVHVNEDDKYSASVYGQAFWILKATYNALVIDYRLMCCLLFLEHAVEIKSQEKNWSPDQTLAPLHDINETGDASIEERVVNIDGTARMPFEFSRKIPRYTGLGYLFGLLLLSLQIFNGLQYMGFTGWWSSGMVLVNDSFIFIMGTYLMKINNLKSVGNWRESDSIGIDATVGIMGGIACTFWIVKTIS